MAYSTPEQWSHGDVPTAAKMNKYSDSLNALYALANNATMPAQLWSYENFWPGTWDNSNYYFVHRYRWLIYRGDGEIVDPSGVGATVDVSGSGSDILAYDLDAIEWMTPGKLWQAKDFVFCLEDRTI